MTNSRARLTAFRGDDRGSAVAFLPILGLLVIAGCAALAGIALQPSDSAATESTPISAGALGAPCTEQAGPVPIRAEARASWLDDVGICITGKVETAAAAQTNSGFGGVVVTQTFAGQPALILRWNTTPPPVIVAWAAKHEGVVLVASPTTALNS